MSAVFSVDYAQMSRERALNGRVSTLEEDLGSAQTQLQNTVTQPVVIPTIGNRVRNGEFDFNDAVYITATYAGNPDRPFGWYAQDSTVTTAITETVVGTESTRSIKLLKTGADAIISLGTPNQLDSASGQFVAGDAGAKIIIAGAGVAGADLSTTIAAYVSATRVTLTAAASTAISGRFFATYPAAVHSAWHKGQGNVWLGGIDALYAPIPKTLFYPGKNIFIVGKAKFNSDILRTALDPTWRLRLAIWDNTVGQQKIITGSPFAISGRIISGAGAATRHYIVKVITGSTVYYLSDVTTPLSIGSLPAVVPAGSAGEVLLSWSSFTDAEAYEVYRSDDGTSLSDYYKLIRITNGDTTFIDQGGRPGSAYAFPSQVNPRAEIFVENFGTGIKDSWLVFKRTLPMPGGYNFSATTNRQHLRIDVVDATDTPVTMDDITVLFDQVGAGLTKGGFDYALEDLQFTGNVVISSPDPSTGGSGGGGGGGGDDPFSKFGEFGL